MGRSIGLFLVAVAAGLLVYWLAAPHFLAPPQPSLSGNQSAPTPLSTQPSASNAPQSTGVGSSPPISAPLTPQQQAADTLEAKRAPYYDWARSQAGNTISDLRPADDDGAVLQIYVAQDDPQLVMPLIQSIVTPYAYHYGFRHVRIFLPNPTDASERYRLYAEANADDDGTWHTFLK